MVESTVVTWDNFFKVWAIIGPLLAGVASTLWSRHVQLSDRKDERSREEKRARRADAEKMRDHRIALQIEKHKEIKDAIARFMASSHEYVFKQSSYWTEPTAESKQAGADAYDKFTYSSQLVTLLGNEELSDAVTELWNATILIPKSWNQPSTPEYDAKIEAYRSARAKFNEVARKFLAAFDVQSPSVEGHS